MFNPNYDIMRENYGFESRGLAMRFYGRGDGTALMERNIAMDGGLKIKIGNQEGSRIRNSVSLANSSSVYANNAIIGKLNYYADRGFITKADIKDCIQLSRVENLDQQAEFADPLNGDFRLQSTSRFRGTGDNGDDRGPYPPSGGMCFSSARMVMTAMTACQSAPLGKPWGTL